MAVPPEAGLGGRRSTLESLLRMFPDFQRAVESISEGGETKMNLKDFKRDIERETGETMSWPRPKCSAE
jgi:hypothetical protein